MIQFEALETSYRMKINGKSYMLSEADIDAAFWATADLIDHDYTGAAPVTLGSKTVVLTEPQWQEVYDITENHIQNDMELNEGADIVLH